MALAVFDKLRILMISAPKVIKEVVSSEPDVAKGLAEAIFNLIYNKEITLTTRQKVELKKYKTVFRKISNSKTSPTLRRSLLVRHCLKIIPLILQVTLPFLNQQYGRPRPGIGADPVA